MENCIFFEKAKNICDSVVKELPLAPHSSFKAGGKAEFAAFPKNADETRDLLLLAASSGINTHVIGNASNVIFDSGIVKGLTVFTSNMRKISVNENKITAECGTPLSFVSAEACNNSLSGMEFSYGIPGSVGGAVYMNAGAYGGEISNILSESICISPCDGKIFRLSKEEHDFSYRNSVFRKKNYILLSSVFELKKGEKGSIEALMSENMKKRREKQPLEFPNAGSIFKRPDGAFAGKLIEDAGLKGMRVGGAEVSEKHAGFIVNRGGATSDDILMLIEKIIVSVKESSGITLEPEVIYIK
ncbi:MAG: UDP-N-acetylmuramate dehydrogenase [Eubacteriales bacterium]